MKVNESKNQNQVNGNKKWRRAGTLDADDDFQIQMNDNVSEHDAVE